MRYALAAVAALVACAPAGAAVQTLGFSAEGTYFIRVGAPSSEVTNITPPGWNRSELYFMEPGLDPSADFDLVDIPPTFVSMPPSQQGAHYNVHYTSALDRIEVYMAADGIALSQTENDVYLSINHAFFGTPQATQFQISSAASPGGYWTATTIFAGVPEPASWAMMIAGFGLVGGAMRRSRRHLPSAQAA